MDHAEKLLDELLKETEEVAQELAATEEARVDEEQPAPQESAPAEFENDHASGHDQPKEKKPSIKELVFAKIVTLAVRFGFNAESITRLKYFFKAIASPDKDTRIAIVAFYFSVFGILTSFVALSRHFHVLIFNRNEVKHGGHDTKNREIASVPAEAHGAKVDDGHGGGHGAEAPKKVDKKIKWADPKLSDLGIFKFKVSFGQGVRTVAGVNSMGEIEVVIITDHEDTKAYLDANKAVARDQIVGIFQGLETSQIFSTTGKARLKKAITAKLNRWLPGGQVVDTQFTNVSVR